jgi:DNA-binding beta-propeller fold protein YncE
MQSRFLIIALGLLCLELPARADFGSGPGEFMFPTGLALDQAGNIYVSELGNDRIQKLGPEQQYLDSWGRFGRDSSSFDDPLSLALGPDGNLYIVDSGNRRVVICDTSGITVGLIALPDSSRPWGLAFASERLYVSDRQANQVLVFNRNRNLISRLGEAGSENGQFLQPRGLAADRDGNIYVVDSGNNRLQVFSPEEIFLRSWGSYGEGEGEFDCPSDVFVTTQGQLIVTDSGNDRFQEFSLQGLFSSFGGGSGTEPGRFLNPTGAAIDIRGNIYIVDTDNHRLQMFSSE